MKLSSFADTVRTCLDEGSKVWVHWWFDGREMIWRAKAPTPLPPEERIFMVECDDGESSVYYVRPDRLLHLPLPRARELAEYEPKDREQYELHDGLRRALRRPERFGPPPDGIRRARAPTSEEILARRPDADAGHELPARGPWCPDYGQGRRRDDDPAYRDMLEQLGLSVGDDGRWRATPLEQDIAHWAAELMRLDHSPSYVNGVPVRRLPCAPLRFEVSMYELTAEQGLGTGGRQRITRIMTRLEAAAFVRAGHHPHYRYSRSTDRWTEVQ